MTRGRAAIGAAITIAVGIASRKLPIGFLLWDKSLGDALYTVMIYFFVAFARGGRVAQGDSSVRPARENERARPTVKPHVLGLTALGISIAVETFQLTGIPSRLPRILQFALGTSFAMHDIACYILGAAAVTAAHYLLLGRSTR